MDAGTSKRTRLLVLVLLSAMLACSMPMQPVPAPTFDANELNVYIAQTAQAALTLSAIPATVSSVPTSTLYSTQTGTPTPNFTSTPPVPVISVSTDTNCRSGPGKVYDYEGALVVGSTAEVFGVDPTRRYWYIRNPDHPKRYCWVWDEYATVLGNVAFVPVYTPPPTPTPTYTPLPTHTPLPVPDFQVSYASMDTCSGWWLEFKIKNTGKMTLKSVQIELADKSASKVTINLTDGFVNINGCLSTNLRNALEPGAAVIVSSAPFPYNPIGHLISAKLTVCSKLGLSGSCASQKLRFTP